MPRIFDNIENALLPALREVLESSKRADFCVGYFNLRGWKAVDTALDAGPAANNGCCRVLVGMQGRPGDELRESLSLASKNGQIDNSRALRLKKLAAEEFRDQLVAGAPTNEHEQGLRLLRNRLKAKQVVVKLHLRFQLHAKLYLIERMDTINPMVGFVGSSNLTFSGLQRQGELNVDVMDHDSCLKLQDWFDERWNDQFCIDISDDLVEIIDESWAREESVPPHHIYLKIAYHLSREARAGLDEFRIPRDFGNRLFEFQEAAVRIAAHHLNKRGGVVIGDVVGLGKTLMATALAKIVEQDHPEWSTAIICPTNLQTMWQSYVDEYGLRARVIPLSRVETVLRDLPGRFRLLLIDESHNLRNREGKRYRAIQEYIKAVQCPCILLSATPYNKSYVDLSNQLRLFVSETQDLGIRPEQLIREIGETEFIRRHQAPVRSLAAFEKSEYPDDWRDLMRLYLVRRTRGFIQDNYAETDPETGRKYLTYDDGTRSYFPVRVPRTVKFEIDETDPDDAYARLFAPEIVDTINSLNLPRYGLGNYIDHKAFPKPTPSEREFLNGLSRAGQRLMGFSRTNLFKRLESGGPAFIQSVDRHILRNFIFLHAIENDLPLPIGTQGNELLDPASDDEDADRLRPRLFAEERDDRGAEDEAPENGIATTGSEDDYRRRAAEVYASYERRYKRRFKWLRASLFERDLQRDLRRDAGALMGILQTAGHWDPASDAKLNELCDLLQEQHPAAKVIVFTQFADTVRYLTKQLRERGVRSLEGVTGGSKDPTAIAWRFSPVSNNKQRVISPADELRVLISTDVLSEGQNLQDCAIVVNYDLPWAIIRLIQRAGRVDRIGQEAEEILCYSFLPADGVEKIIRLRSRVVQRLRENEEVVGADEAFFEDDDSPATIQDLYNEKADILDGDDDSDTDLASQAYQIWKNATEHDPKLARTIEALPNVIYSTKPHEPTATAPEGVIVYMRTADDNDALALIDTFGNSVTQSQLKILQLAACGPKTPALPRYERHHQLVEKGVKHLVEEEKAVGGQLGRPSGARFRTYERLKAHAQRIKGTLWGSTEDAAKLKLAVDDIYRHPLRQAAIDTLNRQLRSGISDEDLATIVIELRDEGRLSLIHDDDRHQEPQIICSLGLFRG